MVTRVHACCHLPAPRPQEDFLPFGRLYAHRAQLLLWASFRGQVLARTVDGMCMYGTALAMQAVQDAMTAPAPTAPNKGGAAAGAGGGEGRLRLTGVQKLMVRGIMRVRAHAHGFSAVKQATHIGLEFFLYALVPQ